jgi:hypothetical protein
LPIFPSHLWWHPYQVPKMEKHLLRRKEAEIVGSVRWHGLQRSVFAWVPASIGGVRPRPPCL